MKFDIRPYQLENLKFAAANPRGLDLSCPGVGKTLVAVLLTDWYVNERNQKVIWVQPNGLRKKNLDELYKFGNFQPGDVEILDKSQETLGRRKRQLDPMACQVTGVRDYIKDSKAKVFVIGYKFFSRFWERLIECHPTLNLLIGDELHLPGGWTTNTSQSTRAMHGFLKHAEGFWGMTGSLLRGKLDNAYPVISVIEPRYYGTYRGFLSQHSGYQDDYGRVLYWVNTEKVTQILEKHSVRTTFEEAYGKQARVYETELVQMEPKMFEAYKEFEEMAILELEQSFLDGSLPGVNAIRCRQILGHPETFGLCEGETSGKDQRLEIHGYDHVGDGGLLVFSPLVPEVERAAKVLEACGLKVGVIHGGHSPERRAEIDHQYRNGDLDAICATYLTAGTGWNWQRTKTIIQLSYPYGSDEVEQAIRRGERALRDHPLRIVSMEYENSIDQHIKKVIAKKAELDKLVLDAV